MLDIGFGNQYNFKTNSLAQKGSSQNLRST